MSKKYELLKDDYIKHKGKILYRIRALRNFGRIIAGFIGGYVESENNLSHDNYCWIYDNAKVYDNARVHEHAKIYDNSEVYGNAQIYGNAIVYNNAKSFGNAKIFDNAKIFGNAIAFGDAQIYENAQIYGDALVRGNAKIHGITKIHGDSIIFGKADISKGTIIGEISIPYKKIFQYQCTNRMLTAILTEDDEILYSIGCQDNITEKKFVDRIHNEDGGLEENPYREEYLKLIPLINIYLKGE